jgi:hypothetical protein
MAILSAAAGFADTEGVAGAERLLAIPGHGLAVFIFTMIGCYLLFIFLALPAYLLCWKLWYAGLAQCLVAGVLIGGGPFLILTLLQFAGYWPTWDDESLGGIILIASGKFTPAGVEHYLWSAVEPAALGAAVAFMFWWIAIRGKTAAKSSRLVGNA